MTTTPLTAAQAAALAPAKPSNLDAILEAIRKAAMGGERAISILDTMYDEWSEPNMAHDDADLAKLRELGYTIDDHTMGGNKGFLGMGVREPYHFIIVRW